MTPMPPTDKAGEKMTFEHLDGEDERECEAATRSEMRWSDADETARFALTVGAHEILLCRSHARMVAETILEEL